MGTSKFATNVNNIDSNNFDLIYEFVLKKQIDTIIVGPEGPLDRGIVDFFKEKI